MTDKEVLLKLYQQQKKMQQDIEYLVEAVSLLVEIETNKIDKKHS